MRQRFETIEGRLQEIIEAIMAAPEVPVDRHSALRFRLCVEEAVSNILTYAYPNGDGWLEFETYSGLGYIRLCLKDGGKAFNPIEQKGPDFSLPIEERSVGGLGIHYLRTILDKIQYKYNENCNELTMTMYVGKAPLSQSQLGIWYACQNLNENTGNYQVPFLFPLPQSIDLNRLKKALEAAEYAHFYINSIITTDEGEPMFEKGKFHPVEIRQIQDINDPSLEFGKTMPLVGSPLYRLELYKTDSGNYFFMDFHHIMIDASALNVFLADVNSAYLGKRLQKEQDSGREIAFKEAELRSGKEFQEQREWYLKEFASAADCDSKPTPSNLIPDDFKGGIVEEDFQLPVSNATLDAICARYGVKKSLAFSAAWGYMLANFTAEDKACFGTIFNSRFGEACARSVTMMVHTLPVYMDVPAERSIADWLKALSLQQEKTRQKTAYSFSDLRSDLGMTSDILFGYQGKLTPGQGYVFEINGVKTRCKDFRTPIPGTVLNTQLFAIDQLSDKSDFLLRIAYDSGKYTAEIIHSMVDSFCAIVNSMNQAEVIGDLKVASSEQTEWLDQRNPKDCDESWRPVIDSFSEIAKKQPDAECCVIEDKRYTYKQIDEISDGLAVRIQSLLEIKSDNIPVVSFICPRNEWMVIMPLAIVKAGCTYQPLDSSYPVERLSFMAENASASLLLCTDEFKDLVNDKQLPRLIVETPEQFRNGAKPAPVKYNADDCLVLLYTSGTTGTPKGVVLTQYCVASFVRNSSKVWKLDNSSRSASYASYGFDAFMMDLWTNMTAGACLFIISDALRFDLEGIKNYFIKESITHAIMTTQVGTQMAVNYPDIPSFKQLGVGGEKLVSITPPSYEMINMYGPTECSVYITHFSLEKQEKNIPIGDPTESTRIYIVNKACKRVPLGAAGELWASGPQVGGGYLGLPEKTAAVFVDNPFSNNEKAYAKAYRTGDIVRYREDGKLEFIGRKDGQVKIRGFRIELKEVEAVIREFPGISEVTVQAFDLEDGGKAIAAYIVADQPVDTAALNDFIRERKPPYMVPAVTMQLESIPLNVNGKVDKKQLPKPQLKAGTEKTDHIAAPLNKLEEALVDQIGRLTSCYDFDITTPLSYVGLTSISSLKLSVQLYKTYGIQINAAELTHGATLQSIENLILESLLSGKDKTVAPSPSEAQTSEKVLSAPLSNAQTGVYYECLKNKASTVYNIPFLVTFPEGTKSEDLKAACEKVIAAHPVLLSRIDSSVDPPVIKADKNAVPDVSISDKKPQELKESFVKPFDLENGPLYRAVVCGNSLLLDIHHLVMDGSSTSIFLHQICDALEGKEIQEESFSFFEHAIEESKADSGAAEKFFAGALSKIEESTSLPADLHGNETEGRQSERSLQVDHEKISAFAKKSGITPASVYLAALEYIAARYNNSKQCCICTISSGRADQRISDTVGMFVNTLALSAEISDASVSDFLSETAANFGKTLENENYPFAKIADKYGISPEIMFVYQVGVIDRFTVGGKEVRMEEMELSAPKAKFSLLVEERDGSVCLTGQYNNALYSSEMVDRLLESMSQLIDNMTANPQAPVCRLSIISPRQQEELSAMNFGGQLPMPIRILHKGFEHWAEQTPDNTAVVAIDKTLTYKELDLSANCIANALLAKGLEREDAVVVLLPRRSTTLSCILGILKAGGAYVPCDPEYPSERIKLIAEDSGARFIVTTKELLADYAGRGIDIDELLECKNSNDPKQDVKQTNLAYYIYTSGSTGRPKGVAVEHGNITTCIGTGPGNVNDLIVSKASRISSVFTISFDAFTFEFWMTLFHGRTFIFADEIQAKDPIALTELLQRTGADYVGGTSSRLLQYLELPSYAEYIKKCKVINQGGEKFSDILLDKLRKLNPDADILNGYGPTEISIACNTANLKDAKVITVGRPLTNYYEWILDKDGNELPVGVTGELCVGGEGVTRGYRNLPDKTAEKYIQFHGMRAFKTGDYARWQKDGQVVILGRTDNQVKLRGLRIELGEVESAISQFEGIKNVLVKICNIQGRDHLSAYFTATGKIDITELKKTISSTLTAYMVPDAYLQMDALPMTPNGKVDFRHLPEPELAKNDSEYVAPANPTEQYFADCFAKILGLEKVGATDSFFELGGTSLVVMKVVITAQQNGYEISYQDVFANPSPRKLAKLLDKAAGQTEDDNDADIKDYNYDAIDKCLESNKLENFIADQSQRPLGNVLLTGATGFLGIHICKCLLDNYPQSKIYCLLRSRKGVAAEARLRQMMFYYFERDIRKLMGERIFVIEGDVTSPIKLDAPIDTVINCAALVKHFAKGTEIEDVNVGGVRNCIEFCLEQKARLIQVSTYSVGGMSVNGYPDITAYNESMLWKGQWINNQYVHSKIMGERLILEAIATRGLDAKIMRVGNLSARSEDGEFQINAKANSFMGRLRIFQMLGQQPYSSFDAPVEFSPIDQTSKAICLLAGTNSKCTVFHPYNGHYQMLGDIVAQLSTIGTNVRLVEDKDFMATVEQAKKDENVQEKLSAMLAYESKIKDKIIRVIPPDNKFTLQVLLRLGFRWDVTSWNYVDQFLEQIDSLDYFDMK